MKTMIFKTNINCEGCVSKVKETLNNIVGENKWTIDIENPDKLLTITNQDINANSVIMAIKKIGFTLVLQE